MGKNMLFPTQEEDRDEVLVRAAVELQQELAQAEQTRLLWVEARLATLLEQVDGEGGIH